MIRAAGVLVLAALLPATTGCFLFGGGEDKEKKKEGESMMDASTGSETSPLTMPPDAEERGPSPALPVAALAVSLITLMSLIVHASRSRRHADPG